MYTIGIASMIMIKCVLKVENGLHDYDQMCHVSL
jgi:hypothetical protein